jgi:EAL domain-containing protein (putative c-di-GMP-specific phosphodiesterase class I)
VLPSISRVAGAMGLRIGTAPGLLDIVDDEGGRRIDRLLQRLARELTAAETEAVRVVTDPPGEGAALTARLLTAPSLAVELARRGVTVEVGVLTEAEFWSVYQPIVSLADRSVVAHEALLRGVVDNREVGGGDLFFVAEQAGWLHRLDRIGRESAIAGAVPWLGDDDLFVNFNPTSIFRPQVCLASTERAVHDTGIAPEQLVFEVVESHAIADRGHLVSILDHYRSLGWRVALDDVGAGWSSLSLLAAVRPEVVKLDKALVQELPDDGARTVLKAVTDLAHQLGAVVVAEGIETEVLAEEVTALGADLGQGWLFGRPVRPDPPVEEAEGRWQPVTAVRTR